MTVECPICAKHRGEGDLVGPVVYADDLIVVTHRPSGPAGYLFIEARRHAEHLDDLTAAEAGAVGRLRTLLAARLRIELAPQAVLSAVLGLGIAHFHEHVFVRYAGTPAELPWWQPWDEAPAGDVGALVERLRAGLSEAFSEGSAATPG